MDRIPKMQKNIMGSMKNFHCLLNWAALFVLMFVLSGCMGGTFDYVETVNKASNEVLTGRYVSHHRSVKVNVIDQRLRFEFAFPRGQPRVNKRQIEISLKRFDFGEWVKRDRRTWFKYVALKSTPTCADNKVEFKTDLPVLESEKPEPLDVVFAQNTDGIIKITVRGAAFRKIPLASLEIHLKRGTSHQHVTCLDQWRDVGTLGNIATHLMQLRNSFIVAVRKPVGFDLKTIGTRLSRKSESPPPVAKPEQESAPSNPSITPGIPQHHLPTTPHLSSV